MVAHYGTLNRTELLKVIEINTTVFHRFTHSRSVVQGTTDSKIVNSDPLRASTRTPTRVSSSTTVLRPTSSIVRIVT